jgi:hypothetical protein
VQNYAQYPAFHLPYHPPVYPALLALFFSLTGTSYVSARVFIALCLWVCGCFGYLILKRTGVRDTAAFGCSLLLMTLPEIGFWSRDAMAEVPALALILAGSYFFLRWLTGRSGWTFYIAFVFAEAAFLSRYLTAGILPAWFLCALLAGKFRKLLAPWTLLPPALYLACSALWASFAVHLARFETMYGGAPPNTNYAHPLSAKVVAYYIQGLPSMAGWLAIVAAGAGLIYASRRAQRCLGLQFWLSWLISYVAFVEFLGIYQEHRYFIYALPAIPGLAAELFHLNSRRHRFVRYLPPAWIALCVVVNIVRLQTVPRGLVGYEALARQLAGLRDRGNVLVSTPYQADLIFRYRSNHPVLPRAFLRGDRTLAVRPPNYTDSPANVVARNTDDVIDIIRRGRVRYIVSCSPAPGSQDSRQAEMILLDLALDMQSAGFALIAEFPLRSEYERKESTHRNLTFRARLWRYTGELASGPSEIPVLVPTAGMAISPQQN